MRLTSASWQSAGIKSVCHCCLQAMIVYLLQEKVIVASCPLAPSLILSLPQSKFEGNPWSRLASFSSGNTSILKREGEVGVRGEGGDSSVSAILLLTNCCLGDRLLLLPPLHIWGVCKDVQGSPLYWRLFYSADRSHKKVITLWRKCHRDLFRNVSLRHLQNLLAWSLLDLHIGGTSLCVIPFASWL